MKTSSDIVVQVVDWRAAFVAAIVAGTVFLLVNLFVLPTLWGGNAWIVLRLIASVVLGQDVLAPPATFDAPVLVAALLTHYAISIPAIVLLAVIIHRYGMLVGVIGGALFGACLYAINMYTLTLFFPQFFMMNTVGFFVSHVVFGAIGGVVYEALEVERFVPVPKEARS